MNPYVKNIEYLCKRNKLDMSSLADQIGIDFTDLRRPTPDDLVKIADHFGLSIDVLLRNSLQKIDDIRNRKIKLLVMDVDGVLTDAGMYYSESGDEYKKFNAKDGMAIKRLAKQGIRCGLLSNGTNKNLVSRRATTLGIELVEVSHTEKIDVLKAWCAQLGIELSEVGYIGDDINDEPVMRAVGLAVCPADAVNKIKLIAHLILTRKGGEGCIRELVDEYLLNEFHP
jgi:3-deoxy-D-manno-octulosonate 8-phosphate phosphatase (KDO 8-P phosphatase)